MSQLKQELTNVPIPLSGQGEKSGQRVVSLHPCAFLVDILLQEFLREGPDHVLEIVQDINTENWQWHKLRLECEQQGDIAIPFGVFVDGAAWRGKGVGSRESVQNYFVNLVGFKRRRIWSTIRKDFLCGTPQP